MKLAALQRDIRWRTCSDLVSTAIGPWVEYHRHSALASYLVVGEMTAHADHNNKGKPGTFKKQLGTKK